MTRFATIRVAGFEQAAVQVHGNAWAPLDRVERGLTGDLLALIARKWSPDRLAELADTAAKLASKDLVAAAAAHYCPPYRQPRKIWGIGLNYREHAADLDAEHPAQPASFLKGDHTIIGAGDAIRLPPQSGRVTAEAELGLVIGRQVWDVTEEEALDQLFGVCPILDQTAEDILALNPRYLTRAKNFPTFFAFGPEIVTLDEFAGGGRRLDDIEVGTYLNGRLIRANTIANMAHSPRRLVSFHSQLMPFHPGDVISTGTPGAAVIAGGDVAEARIDGLRPLTNPVVMNTL